MRSWCVQIAAALVVMAYLYGLLRLQPDEWREFAIGIGIFAVAVTALTGDQIEAAFATARWPATARMLIGAVDGWRKWALFTLPDLGRWSEGAVTLIGDAAHAMLPFAAQGAGMAIEDAVVLAKALGDSTGGSTTGIPAALKRYARMRRGRVRMW